MFLNMLDNSCTEHVKDFVVNLFSYRAAVVASTTKTTAVKRNPGGGGPGGPQRQTSDNLLAKLDDKDKKGKKYFRILAVVLYLISVSMGAIILGIYYSIFWEHKSKDVAPIPEDEYEQLSNTTNVSGLKILSSLF